MRVRQFVMAGAVLLALGGCGGSGGDGERPDIVAPPSADPGASAAAAARAAAATDVNAYLAELASIDAKLAVDKDKAVDNGKAVCLDAATGTTDAELAKGAATRFGVDEAAAVKVVAATRGTLCPGR